MGIPLWRPRDEHKKDSIPARTAAGVNRLHNARNNSNSGHRRTRAVARLLRNRPNANSSDLSSLDRIVQRRFEEKEDLLKQLEFTATLLDQFLSARSSPGFESSVLPSLLTEELPSILSTIGRSSEDEPQVMRQFAEHVIQQPPHAMRLQILDGDIAAVHRRIRDQLNMFGQGRSSVQSPPPSTSRREPDYGLNDEILRSLLERRPSSSSSSSSS